MGVFDEAAPAFTCSTDRRVRQSRYLRGEMFLAAAAAHIAPKGYILDYGCGPGRISTMLARRGFRVLGLDPSDGMIAAANEQSLQGLDVRFQLTPECSSNLPAGDYDGIVCSSVIEYVPEPAQLLSWFCASLRVSGVLIISFANRYSLWRTCGRLVGGSAFRAAQKQEWSGREFCFLLERSGFAVVQEPVYYESPFDRFLHLHPLCTSPMIGTLGLVVAARRHPECGHHETACARSI